MGAKDDKITPYLQKPENFCGLFNGGVFKGKTILTPDKLTLLPRQQSVDKQGFAAYVEGHPKELEALSAESGEVLLTLLGENRRLTKGKEAITVCTALEELKQDWKNEGRSDGIHIGENRIMTLVTCMIHDGLSNEILRLNCDEHFKKKMLRKYHL